MTIEMFYKYLNLQDPEEFRKRALKANIDVLEMKDIASMITGNLTFRAKNIDRRTGKTTSKLVDALYEEYNGNTVVIVYGNAFTVKWADILLTEFRKKLWFRLSSLYLNNRKDIKLISSQETNFALHGLRYKKIIYDLD